MRNLLLRGLDLAAWGLICGLIVVAAVAQQVPRRDVARDVGGFP